jgi:F-type H+-transporting ATPase subunit c
LIRDFRDLFERLEQMVVVEEEETGCGWAAKARFTRRNGQMVRKLSTVMGTVTMLVLASPLLAMAQEGGGGGHAVGTAGLIAIAANIGIGIAAFGSALGQGRVGAAAMESIGRNPNSTGQLFTPMIIALAFIEALTLYAFVVAFLLQGKI